jgi:hypothetical protein
VQYEQVEEKANARQLIKVKAMVACRKLILMLSAYVALRFLLQDRRNPHAFSSYARASAGLM